ncbi:MAG TPA: hypothetical protein VEF54_03075 [archaeon]|nr:hypothetical protein [archaeon]
MKARTMHKIAPRSTKKHHELLSAKGFPEAIASTHPLPGKMQARRHTRG